MSVNVSFFGSGRLSKVQVVLCSAPFPLESKGRIIQGYSSVLIKIKSIARVIDQAALDAFAGRPSSFGGWQKEQQTVWEGWGEQGGGQEQAALSAGLQGVERGEEGAAVLSPHWSLTA